ncbi:DoxX family protein [Syntrophobotulus glycolicus DSM 8271]|uniref:DoxX family protein n=1 Tax=Syntrophobotulus glycolicus (strain DSM 8271 / FlGlyR) TaxID=645991 RepID=F0SW46_SYNGF|nr:DoxX family membrane protein [Syntrophobotulus glycolicus]ADY56830.1 DoxX family protein [Syntrophobotulus glycolicus DSM 8271]
MFNYFSWIKEQFKETKTAVLAVIFTVARIIYGWAWLQAGWGKATTGWLNFQGGHASKLIDTMAANMLPPKAHGFDPLYINKLWAWVAGHIFNSVPGLTDFFVPLCEMAIGILMILGFRLFWTALLGLFLNVQFIASGSANNFGYIWTNIIIMNLAKYGEMIGLSGYCDYRKGRKAGRAPVSRTQTAK